MIPKVSYEDGTKLFTTQSDSKLDNTAVGNSYKQGFLIWLVSKTNVNFSDLLLRVDLLLLRVLIVFLGFATLPL